jgi:chitin synthase
MASSSSPSAGSGDLTSLVHSSGSATVYPSDDAVLAVLQSRFRTDLPYARIGAAHLVSINPYKALANTNDNTARDYEERCYKDTALTLPGSTSQPPLPPHVYELAAQAYLLMRRKGESQAVIFRYVLYFFSRGRGGWEELERSFAPELTVFVIGAESSVA